MYNFSARLSFLYREQSAPFNGRILETGVSLIFSAESAAHAITGIWKWVENRQRNVPEYFGPLGAIKLSYYEIHTIDGDGFCPTRSGMPFHEWKYDTHPMPEGLKVRIGTEGL